MASCTILLEECFFIWVIVIEDRQEKVYLLKCCVILTSFIVATKAECVTYHTHGFGYSNYYSFPTPDELRFEFSVKASAYARVLLTDSADRAIEVMIGDSNNTETNVKDGINGTVLATIGSTGILSDLEFRNFWVSYKAGVATVGREMDTAPLLAVNIPGISVDTAEFSSQTTADWIYDPDDNATEFTTESFTNPYSISFPGVGAVGSTHHLEFQVKTASDAVLLFTNRFNPSLDLPVYEIFLGSTNLSTEAMVTTIRRHQEGADLYLVQTPDLLDVDSYICFVVDMIQIPTSTTVQISKCGGTPFFDWVDTDTTIEVIYYAVSSNFELEADWILGCDCGNVTTCSLE